MSEDRYILRAPVRKTNIKYSNYVDVNYHSSNGDDAESYDSELVSEDWFEDLFINVSEFREQLTQQLWKILENHRKKFTEILYQYDGSEAFFRIEEDLKHETIAQITAVMLGEQ